MEALCQYLHCLLESQFLDVAEYRKALRKSTRRLESRLDDMFDTVEGIIEKRSAGGAESPSPFLIPVPRSKRSLAKKTPRALRPRKRPAGAGLSAASSPPKQPHETGCAHTQRAPRART